MSNGNFKFEIGQLVLHQLYDYRGVVYERDPIGRADEIGHQNQTQPDRNQPWYRLMVNGASDTAYVAESNLGADVSCEPIVHPLLERYFQRFQNGHYAKENLN